MRHEKECFLAATKGCPGNTQFGGSGAPAPSQPSGAPEILRLFSNDMAATSRIYYEDCYAMRFDARVEEVSGNRVYLDRTAFYPTSGGQPHDLSFVEFGILKCS